MSDLQAASLWQQVLGEAQLQMTKATFDTWVKSTFGLAYSNGQFTVGVRNAYAKQWLENRLYGTLSRILCHLVGSQVEIRFELKIREEQLQPQSGAMESEVQSGDVLVHVLDDPLKPFLLLQKYAVWYWQPLLGALAFATWIELRSLDEQNEGRGARNKISIEVLAATLACHRQSLTGRKPLQALSGAFGVLNASRIAKIEAIGDGQGVIYWARVLNSLPLLTPEQVKDLPECLQERHEYFLRKFRVDLETWEQLELPTLVHD